MGVSDLTSHVLGWCSISGRANQFSLCAKLIAGIFFAAVVIGSLSFRPNFGGGPHLIPSLLVDAANSDAVPFPQITICPLWPTGAILNARCYEGGKLSNGTRTGGSLMSKVVYAGAKAPHHPDWNCTTVNYNGAIPNNADFGVWCDVNSTDVGQFGPTNTTIAWPGRVVVHVHTPGVLPALHGCDSCIDGVDAAIVPGGQTGFLFMQAHVYDMASGKSVEYRTQYSSVDIPPQLLSVETSNMDFSIQYFTANAIVYREVHVLASAIAGEKFGEFVVLVGGAGIVSWAIFACLKTTLILLVLGKDSLTAGERQPMI